MEFKRIKRLTYIINAVILLLVFGLCGFFYLSKADFLVWFSIPTALVYVVGFVLIAREKLDVYVRCVYMWLTFYMGVTTVCLGYNMGFHLYCLSMIPIIFYTEYMAEKIGKKKISAPTVSGIIAVVYLLSTGYVSYRGPIYDVDNTIAGVFWLFNSAIVLFFLVMYSGIMLSMVGDYEKKLISIAHTDRLTGLYNRHYMMKELEESMEDKSERYVAMIDIDNFKKINDTYGHNAGDYVLSTLSEIMQVVCKGSEISRWGGEEFLILGKGDSLTTGKELMEKLRKFVEEYNFTYEERKILVTITVGVSKFKESVSVDEWINSADEKLYLGKNSGKNKVVI